jgi:hypothetical protein
MVSLTSAAFGSAFTYRAALSILYTELYGEI